MLYADAQLVEAGQGRAVLRRSSAAWQGHLGWTFEEAARSHCQRLVAADLLPDDLVVGRWWTSSGPPCEVDVLGLQGNRTALLGEAKWAATPLGHRRIEALRRQLPHLPDPIDDPWLALWGHTGLDPDTAGPKILGYSATDVITP
ncbi:MAG: DUF234 domain-containing protein [Egibacteraceae bacterium]